MREQRTPAERPENLILGRNPVREALRAGRDMEKILVAEGEPGYALRELLALAREKRVFIQQVDKRKLDALGEGHQGIAAYVSMARYATLQDILDLAQEKGEDPLVVVLDGVTDPHNLGAVLRSAEGLGAHGVVIPERRAVGLTPAAVKAAAGAQEWIPVARVVNMTRAVEQLKAAGVWTYAADMAGQPVGQVDLKGPLALVIGAEGEGVSRLVAEKCDGVISIPLKGRIGSLNASVAAGILLYEAARSRCF